jgi:hypothetical protein
LEVSLASLADQIDRPPPITDTTEQARSHRHLIAPVGSAESDRSLSHRALDRHLWTGVVSTDLRLRAVPAPIFRRAILVGGSVADDVVVADCIVNYLEEAHSVGWLHLGESRTVTNVGDPKVLRCILIYASQNGSGQVW